MMGKWYLKLIQGLYRLFIPRGASRRQCESLIKGVLFPGGMTSLYERIRPILFKLFDKEGWDLPENTHVCSLADFCAAKGYEMGDVDIEPLHADGISFTWLGMYEAYRSFNQQAREYDAVTDFREYPGERTLFGLVREWRMEGTGVRLPEEEE